jgi:N-acylglucosamine 2-epimerase
MGVAELLNLYETHLRQQVLPFWMDRCIDWQHGGINNIVQDDGVVTSTDKFTWSQGRALWTFSAMYNHLDGNVKWLEVARNIAALLPKARMDDGRWAFCLHQDGSVAAPPQSVYVDAFVAAGLIEYARATSEAWALDMALDVYRRTSPLLRDHGTLPTAPHHIPAGLQAHGPSMIFANVYHELGVLADREDILHRALELAEIVMTQHVKADEQVLHEFVKSGGPVADSDAGKTYLPGHVAESMWFLERIYQHHARLDRVNLAFRVLRWHLARGWDPQHGGLLLACHTAGGRPQWHQPDAKVWWSHTESMYALLRAYEVTGAQWCWDWYWRVHEYAFEHFPNWKDGDWFQNLDRQGRPIPVVVKSLAVKDPFHLPRALLYGILVLRRLSASSEARPPSTGESSDPG